MPLVLSTKTGSSKIVWQSDGKILQLTTQQVSNDTFNVEEIGTGRFPSAAIAGEKILVAFTQNEGDKRSVWLY
jgi:hypothetical protein